MQNAPHNSFRGRRLMRRLVSIATTVLLSIGLSPQSHAADQVAETKLTYWGSPFEKQAIEEAIKTFNATHPAIHVTGQHTAYEAYGEKISAMLASGNPPDIAYLDYAQAFPFADGGKLLDLTLQRRRTVVLKC